VAVVQSPSSLYIEDAVQIVYAVGQHIDAFRYRLDITGSETHTVLLTNFSDIDSLRETLAGYEWLSSQLPNGTVGGIVVRRFPMSGNYVVNFIVSGQTTHNGDEESVQEGASITMSNLQVQALCNE